MLQLEAKTPAFLSAITMSKTLHITEVHLLQAHQTWPPPLQTQLTQIPIQAPTMIRSQMKYPLQQMALPSTLLTLIKNLAFFNVQHIKHKEHKHF